MYLPKKVNETQLLKLRSSKHSFLKICKKKSLLTSFLFLSLCNYYHFVKYTKIYCAILFSKVNRWDLNLQVSDKKKNTKLTHTHTHERIVIWPNVKQNRLSKQPLMRMIKTEKNQNYKCEERIIFVRVWPRQVRISELDYWQAT